MSGHDEQGLTDPPPARAAHAVHDARRGKRGEARVPPAVEAVTWARTMLTPRRAVVIDCETTDLPGGVCEVAVVDTTGRILLNSLVNRRRPISPEAQRVHNISDQMVHGAPGLAEVFADPPVTADRRVLAYNAPFDRECLLADSQRQAAVG